MLIFLLLLSFTAPLSSPSVQSYQSIVLGFSSLAESSEASPKQWEKKVVLDRVCVTKKDCALSYRYLAGDGRCCNSCSPIAVNTKTDMAIDAVCTEHRNQYGECTIMKKCVAHDVKCTDGTCVIAKGK